MPERETTETAAAETAGGFALAIAELGTVGHGDFEDMVALYTALLVAHGIPGEESAVRAKLTAMRAAPYQVLILRSGVTPVAMAIAMEMGEHVFLRDFVVAERWRGQGIGRDFFGLLAERWGGRPIRLEAAASHAVAFWRRMGFGVWSVGLRSDCDPGLALKITLEEQPC